MVWWFKNSFIDCDLSYTHLSFILLCHCCCLRFKRILCTGKSETQLFLKMCKWIYINIFHGVNKTIPTHRLSRSRNTRVLIVKPASISSICILYGLSNFTIVCYFHICSIHIFCALLFSPMDRFFSSVLRFVRAIHQQKKNGSHCQRQHKHMHTLLISWPPSIIISVNVFYQNIQFQRTTKRRLFSFYYTVKFYFADKFTWFLSMKTRACCASSDVNSNGLNRTFYYIIKLSRVSMPSRRKKKRKKWLSQWKN